MIEPDTKTLIRAAPFVFVFHELEEYLTVLSWLREHQDVLPAILRGSIPASGSFILFAGALFFAVFIAIASLITRDSPSRSWCAVFAVLILARLENGIGHVAQSVVLGSYAPGVVTAVLIVIPISLLVLHRFLREGLIQRKSLLWMIPAGLIVQLIAVAGLAWPVYRS